MKKITALKILRTIIGYFLAFSGGFAFSGTTIAGIASFADISLVGALSLPFSMAVFTGAVMRCVLTDSVGKCVVKLGAMSVIVIAKMFSQNFSRPVGCGGITAFGVMLSGAAVSWLMGELPEKLLFYALYGAISGFTAYSAAELSAAFGKNKVIEMKGSRGCLLGMIYMIFTAALCAVDIPAVNIGIAAASAVTLAAAYFRGGFGGAVCGALGASGAFLASAEHGATAMILPAAGIIMGFVKRGRIFISAAFFALVCFMLTVLMGNSPSPELTFSIVSGCGVFIAAAPNYSEKWFAFEGNVSSYHADRDAEVNFLSDAIDAVRSDSGRIAEALAEAQHRKAAEDIPVKSVCGSCFRRSVCRNDLCETAGELIPVLPGDCIHKKDAADELERQLRLRTAKQVMELRYSDRRRIMTEQLKLTSELVRDAGGSSGVRPSPGIAARIEKKLREHNISPVRIFAGYTASNRLSADIFFEAGDVQCSVERLCDLLKDELETELSAAAAVSSAKELKIGIFEPPKYNIEIYSSSVCAEGSQLSGDTYSEFSDSLGMRYIVLSDGMGSGRAAAVDSHMVTGLFRRLVCSGMKAAPAIRLVNSVMVTKSREESFATLDAVMLDLDTCVMTSVKSGAAPTIIRRGDDVIKLSSPVFPIGIVEEAELCISEQKLSVGDAVIMFSDGITENAYLYIKELLLRGGNIRDIVENIASKAGVFDPSPKSDDVTVIGIKITDN